MPYFGYARQDRKDEGPRADHRQARRQPDHPRRGRPRAGDGPARRQIQGFFDMPVDHLYAAPVLNDFV